MTVIDHSALAIDRAADGLHDTATERTVARFEVRYRRFLDAAGKPLGPLPPEVDDPAVLIPIYETMAFTRAFDAKAIALQRTGRLGTYPSSLGQEAVPVGMAAAMREEDVLLPTYREHGALHWRGVKPEELFLMWSGDERGCAWSGPREDFPPCIPIATHATHAAGVATAFKLRGQTRVAVCMLGDGATSKGDFYEAVNLAGVWELPLVFVITNNEWAISVPRTAQSSAQTLAQKAIAGGIEGLQVDGNDAVAVHHAAREAVARARTGGGASVIEALTYRLADHTTADDATRYRPAEEVSARWKHDPLPRLRAFLGDRGWWTKDDEEALAARCRERVDAAAEAYLAVPPPHATDMFDHQYARLPDAYALQRAEAEEREDG